MKAKFEEKTYESYFNAELARKHPIFFPPGQVCENTLGFDVAFFINANIFAGFPLNNNRWWLDKLFQNKNLPKIEVNCFFQYKRPDKITTQRGKEWKDWKQSYFRYEIYQDQQKLLESLNNRLQNQALILYASPKTIEVEELYEFYSTGKIIAESNFTEASKLKGHHVNTYIRKHGSVNKAFSEPEEIESLNLNEYLEFVQKEHSNLEYKSFLSNAIEVSDVVQAVMNENEIYRKIFQDIDKRVPEFVRGFDNQFDNQDEYDLFRSLYIMSQFKLLTGIQWCCCYSPKI